MTTLKEIGKGVTILTLGLLALISFFGSLYGIIWGFGYFIENSFFGGAKGCFSSRGPNGLCDSYLTSGMGGLVLCVLSVGLLFWLLMICAVLGRLVFDYIEKWWTRNDNS